MALFRSITRSCLALSLLAATVAPVGSADASAAETLAELFTDLPGWSAGPIQQNVLKLGADKGGLTVVSRRYDQNGNAVIASFMGGTGAKLPEIPEPQGFDSAGGSVRIDRINGYQTIMTMEPAQPGAAVESSLVVWLSTRDRDQRVIAFSGKGIDGTKLLALAKALRWSAFTTGSMAS